MDDGSLFVVESYDAVRDDVWGYDEVGAGLIGWMRTVFEAAFVPVGDTATLRALAAQIPLDKQR